MESEMRAANRGKDPMNRLFYDSLLWVLTVVADLFFREIHPRSSWRVPRSGPILFVAAPHANQV
jgi:glycerol-3-phosphate O-acyltransferase/dihydroxyacetone phosphate acyltransferase